MLNELFTHYAIMRMNYTQRPWAHFSKKGPGRKHQQGQPLTKKERATLKGQA